MGLLKDKILEKSARADFLYFHQKGWIMRGLFAFGLILTLTGCATFGIHDPRLKLSVEPDPAVRGKRALFVLNAPMDADKVVGVLEIFTSPSFKFKRDVKKKYWFISNKIPETALVPRGIYWVRLSYSLGNQTPHYMRMQLRLQ